jgi:hypothetical protein
MKTSGQSGKDCKHNAPNKLDHPQGRMKGLSKTPLMWIKKSKAIPI